MLLWHFGWLALALALARARAMVINSKSVFEAKVYLGLLGFANDQAIVNGELTVQMTSVMPVGKSRLVQRQLPLPLGIDLEQGSDGLVKVVSVSGRGSAKTGEEGFLAGDILRMVTSREKRMAYPQGNVSLGGIGRPQLVTTAVFCERKRSLDDILAALASNLDVADSHPDPMMLKPGSPTLLLERKI